jgi:ribose transport system substrate-binding protein
VGHNGADRHPPLRGTGAEGLRQAVKLLNGEKIEKKIILDTAKITKESADQILKENGLL